MYEVEKRPVRFDTGSQIDMIGDMMKLRQLQIALGDTSAINRNIAVPDVVKPELLANNGLSQFLTNQNPGNAPDANQMLFRLLPQLNLPEQQRGFAPLPMSMSEANALSTSGLPNLNANTLMQQSMHNAAASRPEPVLSGILKQVLGDKVEGYFGIDAAGKKAKADETAAKVQTDYLSSLPSTRFEGPTGKQVPLSIPEQARQYQMGPTKELQQTGNNMLQNYLLQKSEQQTATPASRVVGVAGQPELQQRQEYDYRTNIWSDVGGPIGAKLPYGGAERLEYANRADVRAEKAQTRLDINQQRTNERLDRAFMQQQHNADLQNWRLNNPNYEANQKQIVGAQEAHDTLVARAKNYQDALTKWGGLGDRHNPMANKELSNAYQALTWAVRDPSMQNTGVLNAGEIPMLNQSLADPTSWGPNGWVPAEALSKQVDALIKTSERGLNSVIKNRTPKSLPPEAPNFYGSDSQQTTPTPEYRDRNMPKGLQPGQQTTLPDGTRVIYKGIQNGEPKYVPVNPTNQSTKKVIVAHGVDKVTGKKMVRYADGSIGEDNGQ